MSQAWLVRAGHDGEYAEVAWESGFTLFRWSRLGDLTGVDGDELTERLRGSWRDRSDNAIANFKGQFRSFVHRMAPGDAVVMPEPGRDECAIGLIAGDYRYLRRLTGEERRGEEWHVRPVDWLARGIARAELGAEITRSFNNMTVCAITADGAAGRCAITKCDVDLALQAAHIEPYDGPATNTTPRSTMSKLTQSSTRSTPARCRCGLDGVWCSKASRLLCCSGPEPCLWGSGTQRWPVLLGGCRQCAPRSGVVATRPWGAISGRQRRRTAPNGIQETCRDLP
jgi:hypothetical protein